MWLILTGVLSAWGYVASPAAAQEQDIAPAVKKAIEELAAADKAVVAARNNLASARRAFDDSQFNSATYNARVTAQQVQAAKAKYEKADESQKQDALEAYELAQELAAQRQAALDTAQELLPKREVEAKAAEERYASVMASADKLAGQVRTLLRQAESEAASKLTQFKHGEEVAASAKANAELTAAANAAKIKSLEELVAADKALQAASEDLKASSSEQRAQKTDIARKATQAYAAALQSAVRHLPALDAGQGCEPVLKVTAALVASNRAAQQATSALAQANKQLEDRTNAVKAAEKRVAEGEPALQHRIAKIRATKDLERERAALQQAQTARAEAEKAVPPKVEAAEKARQDNDAALSTAAVMLMPVADEQKKAIALQRQTIANAIVEQVKQFKREQDELTRRLDEAQRAAAQARAVLAAAEKLVGDRQTQRQGLERLLRQRFYRQASSAQDEQRRLESALAKANQALQPKVAVFNKAVAAHMQASESAAKAQQALAAATTFLSKASQDKTAAEKFAQETAAARDAARRRADEAAASAAASQEVLKQTNPSQSESAAKQASEKQAAAAAAAQIAQQSQQAASTAQAALDKTQAAFEAATKQTPEATQASQQAAERLAQAKTALDLAAAEKQGAEKVIDQHRQELAPLTATIAVAKAAAYGGLTPLADAEWNYAKARHLLTRAGFGGTPDEVARLHKLGLHDAVRSLVQFKDQTPPNVTLAVHPRQQPEQYESSLSNDESDRLRNLRVAQDRQQMQNMRQWWLQRMIESARPLEEKLTLFWHGQIPAQYSDVGDSYFMYQQNQLFREHAAGNFAALLYGIAHDAAMLKYLNNDTNVKGRANENLAREIMELFSMGRDQGYSETDIRQGARALTGYTYDPATGQFRFLYDRHDTEEKIIFGKKGLFVGDDFVRLILDTPYPSKFVARQMFIFFAHAEPSIDTVEALAEVLRVNNYELTPMLENLFLSQEFYSARSMATQIKSPVQLAVGLHCELGLRNADLPHLVGALRLTGQELFEPPSVFGWQGGRAWITTSHSFNRYNGLAEILEQRARAGQRGVDVVGGLLAGRTFKDHAEVVDYLTACCLLVPLSQAKRQALIEYLKPLPAPDQWSANASAANARLTRLLVMIVCSPEYQLG